MIHYGLVEKLFFEIFDTSKENISMQFSNLVNEDELNEKEVSLSSKELFKDDIEFSKESLPKSNNRRRLQIWYNLDEILSIDIE